MTSVEQHASHIAALLEPAFRIAQLTDDLPLLAALGRVTARPVLSPVDLPLFRNSQIDGFAVHSADVADVPVRLRIVGVIPAGPATPPLLAPGTAMRIVTGAVVSEGTDCVVPVEDVEAEPGGGADPLRDGTVTVLAGRASGDFVRNRASDLAAGDQLLPAGQVLGPLGATIGHVAMQPGGPQAWMEPPCCAFRETREHPGVVRDLRPTPAARGSRARQWQSGRPSPGRVSGLCRGKAAVLPRARQC